MKTVTVTRDKLIFGPYITDLTESIRDRAESGEDEPTVWASQSWQYMTITAPIAPEPAEIADALSQPFGAVVVWEDLSTYKTQVYKAETWPAFSSEQEMLDYTQAQGGILMNREGDITFRFDGRDIPNGPQVKAQNLAPLGPDHRLALWAHYYVGADSKLYEIDAYESILSELDTWDIDPETDDVREYNLMSGARQTGVPKRDEQSFHDCEFITAEWVCDHYRPGTYVKAVPTDWAQLGDPEYFEGWTLLTEEY